jgi:hypothetical protein
MYRYEQYISAIIYVVLFSSPRSQRINPNFFLTNPVLSNGK